MEFIEAPAFTRCVSEYLDAEAYRELQNDLASNPDLGNLIPGTGGFRKVRWADARRGKARRGGLRIISSRIETMMGRYLRAIGGERSTSKPSARGNRCSRSIFLRQPANLYPISVRIRRGFR